MSSPFFVVGTDRSGSTMFRLMLNEHESLSLPNESWFVIDLVRELPVTGVLSSEQLGLAHSIVTEHPRWKDWKVEDSALMNAYHALSSPQLADVIDATFRLEVGQGPRWGDKTPSYIDIMPELHQLFPKAKFVHIIRDGRDVCISLLSKKWRGSETWTIARYWRDALRSARTEGRKLPRNQYIEVHYENLVTDTEGTLTKICEFLGEPFDPKMLEFHQRVNSNVLSMQDKHHGKANRAPAATDLNRWQTELDEKKIAMIEGIIGPTLTDFGYRAHYQGVKALFPKSLVLLLKCAELSLPVRRKLGLHFPNLREKL